MNDIISSHLKIFEALQSGLKTCTVFFYTVPKTSTNWVFSGSYFAVFEMNVKIYQIFHINLSIQFEYEKIRTGKNSMFWHFSRSVQQKYFLTHYCSVLPFYNLWKHQKSYSFLMFSGDIKRKHRQVIGWESS